MIRVLIVDDDKLARKGLISVMPWEAYSMEVVGDVSNGAKALEFLKDHAVDLMFVDLAMPVMSGIDLMREVSNRYPNINFIVLTFHENFEYVQTALRLGALDYISKAELESENYDVIFQRIIQKLNARERIAGGEVDEKAWESIKNEWYKFYWLYDDEAFENLCEKLKTNNVTLKHIEQLFIKSLVMIESFTGFQEENIVDITNLEESIEWIKAYREKLWQKALQSCDLSKMAICIFKAAALVKENISTPVREEEVAAKINVSRSYFSQNFKKLTGLTFNDYVKKERVKAAKKLLKDNEKTLADVAQAVGYEDVKYFCRVFYEVAHISPSHFRKQLSVCGDDL